MGGGEGVVLRAKSRALHIFGKCSTTELHLYPSRLFSLSTVVRLLPAGRWRRGIKMFKSSIILKNFFGRGSLCSTTAQTKVTQPWPVNRCVAHHQRMTVACMMSQTLSLGENEKERHWASRSWHWGSLPSMTIDNCHASRPHPRILQAPAQCSV